MPVLNNTIRFVIVRNPLVPDNRIIEERDYVMGQTLYDYIGDLKGQFTIILNNEPVSQDRLHEYTPIGGDIVGIAPVPAGGGGGKDVIRLVAIVALAVMTAGVGVAAAGMYAGAMGVAATSTAAVMFGAGAAAVVGIGGNLLINKLLPPQIPKLNSSSSSNSTAQNYGVDGAKNTSTEGIAVPVTYGKFRTAGNIIATHTTMDGQDQWLHLLINAGEGVISTLNTDSILINDQTLASFGSDAKVEFANGNGGQNSFPEFSAQKTSSAVQNMRDIDTDAQWTTFTTSADKEIEAVEVGLIHSIYKINSNSGNQESHSVKVKVQFRNALSTDDSDWADIRTGIKTKYIGKGWHFTNAPGVKGMLDPAGATVTEQQVGTQLIDPTRPNKYNSSNGLFQNYYVYKNNRYELVGESVAPNGSTTMSWRTWESDKIIAPFFKSDTSGLTAYAYGNLICNGKIVGRYHRFHAVNPSVTSYNGSGMLLGTRAAETNITLSGSTSASKRSFYTSPRLQEGRYSVRVCRIGNKSTSTTVSESIVFNEVYEILYADIHYNYSALLRLAIKATSNISSMPTITFLNEGRVIRVWDDKAKRFVPSYKSYGALVGTNKWDCPVTSWESAKYPVLTASQNTIVGKSSIGNKNIFPNVMAFSRPAHTLQIGDNSIYDANGYFGHDNPAWIALDMLTDSRIGGGMDATRIDFWAFKEWADYCTAKGLRFNGVFDSQETLWDQLAVVFRVGRANPLRVGTRYSVAVERPKLETQSFGQDKIKKGTFSVSWLPVTDRANEVEVTYYDEAYDYKQRIIKIYDQEAINTGRKAVSTSMKLIGVTNYNDAVREANFALNSNKLVETVTFVAPISSLSSTIGDVIRVQHDMMNWGDAGKLVSATGLPNSQYSLKLDHPLTFATGEAWSVMIHYDYLLKGTHAIHSKSDNYVYLVGFTDVNTTATRVMVAGVDQKIVKTVSKADGSGLCGIYVEDPTVFVVGKQVQLFATNVMQTASIIPSVYNAPTDTVVATLPSAPSKYSSYMIGKAEFTSKLFTIRNISLASDSLERTITALEYDARVFDDTNTNFNITESLDIKRLAAVESVEADEVPRYDGKIAKIDVSVSWTHSDPRYKSAAVYVSVNSSREVSLGAHISNTVYTANPSDLLRFRIVPYDGMNVQGADKVFTLQLSELAEGFAVTTPTSGTIKNTASGNKIVVSVSDALGVKNIEVWGITESTKINGTNITPALAATLTGSQVQSAGKVLGYTNQLNEFIHVAETDEQTLKTYYYYSCAVDYAGNRSGFTYIGASKPVTAISYNSVSVYCLSALVPPTPTGGSYQTPVPSGTLWKTTPPTRAEDDDVSLLWVSTRRFSNFIDVQDPVWSDPSSISSPTPDVAGQLLKTWTAYASDVIGTNFSFTYDPSKHTWRGVSYNHAATETKSSSPSAYEWHLIVTLTDLMDAGQRAAINALKEGKLVDMSAIATSSGVQGSIDAAVTKVMSDTTTISTAAADGAKAAAIATAASDATAKAVSAMNYSDNTRVSNTLVNAAFEMPLGNNGGVQFWPLTVNGLTGLSTQRRDGATDKSWGLAGGVTVSLGQGAPVGDLTKYAEWTQKRVVLAGLNYGFSVYTGAHRCKVEVGIRWYNATDTLLGSTTVATNNAEMGGGVVLSGYKRIFSYGVAPAGSAYAICYMRKYDTATGQTSSYMMATRAQFNDWGASQVTPTAWCQGVEPAIGDGQVVSSTIADSAITAVKLATAAVTASKLSVAAINPATGGLNSDTVAASQILADAVTSLKIANGAVSAAKTAIAAIDSATGNLTAGSVSASQLVDNAVSSVKIASGAVTATKTAIAAIDATTGNLTAGSVSASQLVSNAVTAVKIASGAVDATKTSIAAINSTTGNLNAGTVDASQLVSNAVTSVKIASGAVDATKTSIAAINATTGNLNAGTVDASQLVSNAVTAIKIASGAVDATKTSIAAIDAATGNLKAGTVDASQLVSNAVTSVKIASGAVDATKTAIASIDATTGNLKAGTVDAAQLVSNAVTSVKVANGAITAAKTNIAAINATTGALADATVNSAQIVADAITAVKIASGAVTANKTAIASIDSSTGNLAAGTVNAAQLVSDAVTSVKIASGAVTAAKTAIAAIDSSNGNLTADSVSATQLVANAVTSVKIASGAVDATKTAIAAINSTTGKLNAGTVDASQLVSNAVTSVKIASGAVDATKTAIAAIDATTGNLKANTVDASQLVSNAVTSVKIASGAVDATKTSIAAISSTTGNLNANTVDAAQLLSNAVTSLKIASGAVDASKTSIAAIDAATGNLTAGSVSASQLVSNAVTAVKIAAGAVDATKTNIAAIDSATGNLTAGSVSASQLASNAVTAVKIASGAVDATKTSIASINATTGALNAGTVDASQLVSNAVTSVKIASGAVDASKTAIAAIDSTTGNLKASTVDASQLVANAVTSVKIATGAVDATKTNIAAIDSATGNLTAGSVSATQLASNAVTSVKIASGAVDATKTSIAAINSSTGALNAGTVDAGQLVANAVTAVKIASGAVDASKTNIAAINATTGALNANTVTATQISDAAITTTKFASGIQPVSIVSALPSVAGYTGPKVVLLTTDSKMYRFTGSAWVSTVSVSDLAGQIAANQIAANTIDSTKLANEAVTDVNIAAGAVSASKMSVRKHMIY